jgi:hemoglobin-like flavoprotein
MNMLEQSCQGNPMMMNLFNLAKQGNTTQIEQIARNLVASKGGNFD